MPTPQQTLVSILGRPAERLQELDRRPLHFAFIPGRFETYVLRDLGTGETLEVSLDLETGKQVDPVELRRRDRERGAVVGQKLEPELLDLLLRHPDLEEIQIRLHMSLEEVPPGWKGEADWLDPDFRREYQSRLDAEFRALEIGVTPRLPAHSPVLEGTFSAAQVIRLACSSLIQSIELVEEPKIEDD